MDPGVAKYYPEDDNFLLEKEDHSPNHQVFFHRKISGCPIIIELTLNIRSQ
jgi:hypothetical protein